MNYANRQSMNKYSPAPWHVEAAHPRFTGDVRCDIYPPQDLPMGSRIPVATDIHPENARLIAAAPDLLAALDLLLSVTIDRCRAEGVQLSDDEEQAWEVALNAIERATEAA